MKLGQRDYIYLAIIAALLWFAHNLINYTSSLQSSAGSSGS